MSALPPLLLRGNCLHELKLIPDESVDAVVTDPPYGLANTDPAHVVETIMRWAAGERDASPKGRGFMGKAWDAFVPPPAVWDECSRILKPGGHLLAFAGSRTFDLMTLSIRFAGFDIRDSIAWLYGSGFPKSMDVSKAITGREMGHGSNARAIRKATMGDDYYESGVRGNRDGVTRNSDTGMRGRELPLTDAAREWEGWGTALKPAFEPVVVARKGLQRNLTVAANVLEHGTGALNIDATRIGTEVRTFGGQEPSRDVSPSIHAYSGNRQEVTVVGRWPANVVLDVSQAAALDQQSGYMKDGVAVERNKKVGASRGGTIASVGLNVKDGKDVSYGQGGGASRFFYVAKAPKSERPVVDGTAHPTVKPLALMRWLLRLVTPPRGVIVDPFAGSGTTLEAAYLEDFDAIGVEMTPDYWPLIEARIARVTS